jgi:hypothetical protein
MKKNFGFDAKFNKIKLSARNLWMGFERGEGELEIENQGRFDQSRFTQETEAIGQQTPRIGESRSKLRFTQRVSSAGCTLNSDSTPHFSSAPSVRVFSLGEKNANSSSSAAHIAPPSVETVRNKFALQEKVFSGSPETYKFPLQQAGAITGVSFTLSSADIELKATNNELAASTLAAHTQKRLAALFNEADILDEDSAV